MATTKYNVQVDAPKYIERKQYGYASGADNPKANFAFDITLNGQQYTFIPDSTIQKGVTVDYEAVKDPKYKFKVPTEQFYFPWFTNQENMAALSQVGQKIDLSDSSISKDLKDSNASGSGVLVPRDAVNFDADIRYLNLTSGEKPITGLGAYGDQLVYKQDDKNFITSEGQKIILPAQKESGGLFGTGIGPNIGFTDIRDALQAASVVAGNYVLPGSSLLTSQLVSKGAQENLSSDLGQVANLAAGATGAMQGNLSNYGNLGSGASAGTTTAAGTEAGLLSSAAVPEMTAQQTLAMIGAEQAAGMTAAETLAAIQAEQAAGGAIGGIAGAGAGASAAGAAGAGALTASELGKLGLIQGGLGLAGGLLQGQSAKGAAETLAAQQAALAEKTLQMGKFQPVGVTTRFGTSAFKTDPVTGAITPSYTLSSEAQAYQDALAKMGTQSLTAGQGLMNLGQQYIGESPEAVRQRYMETQLATLAPSQAQTLAEIRNRLQQTGRGGFATGATAPEAGGLMATSPELAAYYNSLADTQRKLAAQAEQQYQGQVQFGQGLLTGATKPFEGVFGAQRTVETAGQQPLGLSTDFANLVAQRGADQARNYATAMGASYQTQAGANAFNPYATAFQGASSNPLTAYGLSRLIG